MSPKPTIGLSVDVELNGPSLLLNSCLQIGVVAFYQHKKNPSPYILDEWVVDRREWCLHPQEGKTMDPATMLFLYNQPGLMEYIEQNAQDVRQCIGEFCQWYTDLSAIYNIALIVASPASVDYAWITNLVACYCPSWAPSIQLPFSCRCLTTMLHVAEKFCHIDTRSETSLLKQHHFAQNHMAIEDATRQAWIYLTLKSLLHARKHGTSTSHNMVSYPPQFAVAAPPFTTLLFAPSLVPDLPSSSFCYSSNMIAAAASEDEGSESGNEE